MRLVTGLLITLLITVGFWMEGNAQQRGWVVAIRNRVLPSGQNPSAIHFRDVSSIKIGSFWADPEAKTWMDTGVAYYKAYGTGPIPSGAVPISIFIEGDASGDNVLGDFWGRSDYTANFASSCGLVSQHLSDPSESDSDYNFLIIATEIYVFPQMVINSAVSSCGQVDLSTTKCSINGTEDITDGATIVWQVSDNLTDWKTISKATGSTTLSMEPTEFVSLGLTKYGKKYFQVTDLPGTTSEIKTVDIYPDKPAITLTHENPKCYNDPTGSIRVDIVPADASVNQFTLRLFKPSAGDVIGTDYPLSVGQTSKTISGLDYGEYTAQVTNVAGGACSSSATRELTNPTQVTVSFTKSNYNGYGVSCYGSTNGSVTINGSGGAGGYTNFLWDTGSTSQTITNRAAGTYNGSLTDSKGCTANGSTTLTAPAVLNTPLTPSNYNGYAVQCWDKPNGSLSVAPSGGVPGYSYSWSTGSTNSSISGLTAGIRYSVTITDANTCTKTDTLTLHAPKPINFSINQVVALACPGDVNATLQASPVTATIIGSPHYSWSTGATSQSISNVGAGTYTVTVSDDQSCSATKSYTLNNPPAYTVAIAPTSNFNGKFIKCNGGSDGVLSATVRNASNVVVSPQNYEWFKGTTALGSSSSLSSITTLNEGQYKVVITYGTGCKAEHQYFLEDPEPVTSSISPTTNYNGQPISCFNKTDANLIATSGGGTGTRGYKWNTNATTALLSGVGAGTYMVTVTDDNGCTSISNYTLNNPSQVVASIDNVSNFSGYGVSCAGSTNGFITAEGSGGTENFFYSWSNNKSTPLNDNLPAGTYTVTVADDNGCSSTAQQTITAPPALTFSVSDKKDISCFGGNNGYIKLLPGGGVGTFEYSKDGNTWQGTDTFSNLTQGPYTLRLRDGNGCTATTTSTLTQPTQIVISFADVAGATCNNPGGTARAVVVGGTGAYTYDWKDGSLNTVDSDAILTNAPGGIYTVTIRDANLCTMSNNVSITSVDGAQATYTALPAKCFDSSDGSALITITSGKEPFVITWPDGQNTLQGNNLKKDQYDVLIKDANNCTVVKTVIVPGPDAMNLQIQSSTQPTCHGLCDGKLVLTATGGVGGYTYSWNNTTGNTQTNLCAGNYMVVLKDANNCELSKEILLNEPDEISVVSSYNVPSCKDRCDGSLQVVASGGNGDYNYTWASGGNTNSLSNICPGEYSMTIADKLGCNIKSTVKLPNAPDLPVSLGGGATVCVGQSYTLNAGNTWKEISWGSTTGLTSETSSITIKEPGSYWVEVLNELGCVGQDTFLLQTSLDLLNASFLMSGEVFTEDTVVMIDISWPLPEMIYWHLPEAMELMSDNGDVIFGKFSQPGQYEIRLTAHLGECLGETTKIITVLEAEPDNNGGRLGYHPYLKYFELYPNPNDGSFQVKVELDEAGPVTLSIWHSSGMLVKTFQQQGSNLYEPFIDLKQLTSGTYILRLDHSKGREYIRFVVL